MDERPVPRPGSDAAAALDRVAPVVERLAGDLAGTGIAVVLTDAQGRVVARPARSVLAELDASRLDADELSRQGLVAAEAPVRDPRNGTRLGTLSLVCPSDVANALLVPVARRAAHDCALRLLEGSSARDRLLDEEFLRARRGSRAPLVVVGERTLLMNAAAVRIMAPFTRHQLWDAACRAVADGQSVFDLDGGDAAPNVTLSVAAVHDGGEVVGVVLRLGDAAAATKASRAISRPVFGWRSLTEAERALASLVGAGLTNKQAAARLFVSPHTVDSHLRHIFRKLDITSRVELASLVATQREDERLTA
jgi:DNA-binding CsgD family transcriptional regulator